MSTEVPNQIKDVVNIINLPVPPALQAAAEAGSIAEHRSRLVPLVQPRTQDEFQAQQAILQVMRQRAHEDQHAVISPTHIMLRGTVPEGYASLGAMPCVHAWFDSRSKHPLDSLRMIETSEAILATQGQRAFTVAVAESSPFSAHMGRLGYTLLGTTQLWIKTL